MENEMTDKPTRKELILMIDEMVQAIEKLPPEAMYHGVSQYDHHALLLLLGVLFRSFDEALDCKPLNCDINAS